MKQLVPLAVAAVFIAGGGAGALFLKGGLGGTAEASSASDGGGHGESAKSDGHGAKAEKGGHGEAKGGHGGDAAASGEITYYRFSREFVIPIIENGKVDALVILNLNLEVDSALSQQLFSMEPKLRDNIMTTLIKLSADDRTLHSITDVENYETLRSMILTNLQSAVPHGIENVLILDMAKQEL